MEKEQTPSPQPATIVNHYDGEPLTRLMVANDDTSDVFAGRETPNDCDDDQDKSARDGVRALLMKRRLHEYREVLKKLDRDRELHSVERVRMG